MTKQRSHGDTLFICNECGASHTAKTRDTGVAWHQARNEGWRMERHAGAWLHFCGWICRNAYLKEREKCQS